MRVTISGGVGGFGEVRDVVRSFADELGRRGYDVNTAGPARPTDAAWVALAGGRQVGSIIEEAHRSGVTRLVLITRDTDSGTPPHQDADPQMLLVRAAPLVGRATPPATVAIRLGSLAPPVVVTADPEQRLRFLHHDDLARFVADALERPQWRGVVGLAATDALSVRAAAGLLRKPLVNVSLTGLSSLRRLRAAVSAGHRDAITDASEIGFEPAWSARDCLTDFARAHRNRVYLGPVSVELPWRFPWVEVPSPRPVSRDRLPASADAGEFDTAVAPQWPEFTSANVAEAFPGPMTPLSLELALEAVRATGVLAAHIVALRGEIGRAMTREHVGSFGHTVYVNLTVARTVSAMLPGADPTAWRDLLFGAQSGIDTAALERVSPLGMIGRLPKVVMLLATASGQTDQIDAQARDRQRAAEFYAACTDAELLSRLHATAADVCDTWAVAALGSAGVVPIMALIERLGGKRVASQFKGGIDKLASAGLMRGTYDLAEQARTAPEVMTILRDGGHGAADTVQRLRDRAPEFAARFDAVIAEYGHRGPGETELANPVFADTPARLVDAVAKLAESRVRPAIDMPAMSAALRLLARLGTGFQHARELTRDAAMRYTHNYRLIAREIGDRLAADGLIDAPDDVFYLVRDELSRLPDDARDRIARRRAERLRLERQRPPIHFVGRWRPRLDACGELRPGESLSGVAASAGLAKGPVRVLTAHGLDELEPGEVLVAEYTDTGWTPFFAHAAAVVVDTGAEMSHAAVIAREFSIPCVVGTVDASRILQDGQVVEVDGSAGRITRVE